MPKVFVCYSHCDRRWVGQSPGNTDADFVPWLRDKLRHDKIDVWWSAELDNTVGEAADRQIGEAIATSDLALVLVSDDFFISDHILKKELPAIRKRADRGEMQVFPVVVGPVSDWGRSDDATWIYGCKIHAAAIPPLAAVAPIPARWEQVRSEICGAVAAMLQTARPAPPPGGEVPEIEVPTLPPPPAFGPTARLEELRRRDEAHRKTEEAARKAAEALLAEARKAFRTCTEIDALKSATGEEKAGAWDEYIQQYSSTGYEIDKARARSEFWRISKPIELRTIDLGGVTMNFCWCVPGKFTMGSPQTESERSSDEGPVEVTLTKGFWMGETPVTQAQYRAVIGTNPSKRKGDTLPVVQVSWKDAMHFCRKLSSVSGLRLSLPTEAQWEYSCRAGTTTPFHFGATITPDQVNYRGDYPYGRAARGLSRQMTTPVGSFPASPWGLRDMHGNVWEWCADWYGSSLPGGTDPTGCSSGADRVGRGGGWFASARRCRSAYRSGNDPMRRSNQIGFRVALVVN